MKAQSTDNTHTYKGGFATLEILIAFTVLILCMSAVIMVAFGNQSMAVDSEINIEAISRAQSLLEKTRADSRWDFNLINSYSTTEASGSVTFTKSLEVTQKDLFTKEVSSNVSWQLNGRNLSTILTTLLTNRNGLDGGDTCSSVLEGDWKNPQVESTFNFSTVAPTGTYTITDVDVYNYKMYVSANKTTNLTDPTLFVFDVSGSGSLTLLGKIDNDSLSSVGINSITTNGEYAYAANGSRPTLTGQLQIFNVSNPATISLVKNFPLPGNSAQGNTIFYKNGHVYLGTKSSSGPEFNIIDVQDASAPVRKGSYSIGNDINAVIVRDGYAYIASPNINELKILDVSNLSNLTSAGSFNSASGAGNGKSIYLVGNILYLGKTTGAGFDFHILDATNKGSTLPQLGGRDVTSSINGVIVRDYLSFLLTGTPATGTKLQIFKTDDPANITPWNTTLSLSATSNAIEPAMDCEGNRLYISANDGSGQGSIYIIKPGRE